MNNFEHFGIPTEKTISYTLELLTPYEKSLGTIPMVLNYSYKNKLIGLNEIDFDIPAYMIVEDKEIAHPFFHLIENGMIIQVTIVGQREPKQYIVDTANKSTDKSSEALKHIHAFSKEYFLSRKKFLGMELAGRILYYTPDLPDEYATDAEGLARGVLNDIFTKYGITVSHIDETLKKKAREVSIGSGNIYQLISHLEEVFGCIFKFNGNATEVAIYDSSTFGRKTNITISERNIINSFSEDSRYEDMVTRMYVYGSDDVSIASVNPTGLPYIEDLTYFLKEQFLPAYLIDLYKEFIELPKNTGLLQAGIQERNALFQQITEAEFYLEVVRDELRQARHWAEALQLREKNDSATIGSDPQYTDEKAWNSLKKSTDVLAFIDAVRKNTTITDRVFTANNISFVSLLELSRSADEELTNLFKDNLETLQARGGEAGWLAEITRLNNALKAKESEIKSLQQNNDFDNYMKQKLTTEQLIESRKAIEAITIEGEYINSDLDSSMLNELLAEGEKALAKACFPKIQFQVEALDFSQLLDTEDLWNYLTLGDTVFIKSDTGFNYPVYFIGIEHSPESASLNLQFSSAAAMTDSAIFLADLIASATRANGILALNKETWNEAAEGATLIKAQLQQGLDLAKQQLDGASKQQPILDERGFWLYALDANGNPKPEQIRAVNNVIALTEDGWETVNVAITPQGINADTIVVGTLSADRVRLGRFESADKSTFWDLETNEIKIGDNFHFSPSTGLQINFEEEPKHKNLISTAGFFIEQSVILPYGATHRFETNPSTGELSLITPKQSGTYIFYIASDSATLTQDFTLLNNNLAIYGEGTPVIKYALASTQFDLYSEEVAHIPAQKFYTLKPNGTTVINPLGFLQVSITKNATTSETIVKIPAESLALVKNNVSDLTWEDTEISGISSSATITNSQISAIVENDLSNKLTELNLTDEGIQLRVQSETQSYIDANKEQLKGADGRDGLDGIDGKDGLDGPKGEDGKSSYTHIAYANNSTGTLGFSTDDGLNKTYIGMYVDNVLADSTDPTKYTWTLIKGSDGKDGIAGKDGVGIKTTTITYGLSISETTTPTNFTSDVPTLIKGQYLWTKTVWTYTDGSSETAYTKTYIAKDGNDGKDGIAGKDGVGIKTTTITYASSTSGTVKPTDGWTTAVPDVALGEFIWTKTVWTYTDNTTEVGYSVGKIGDTGAKGDKGDKGDTGDQGEKGEDGISITSVKQQFYLSTSSTTQTGGSWSDTQPAWVSGKHLWTRLLTTYSDESTQATGLALDKDWVALTELNTELAKISSDGYITKAGRAQLIIKVKSMESDYAGLEEHLELWEDYEIIYNDTKSYLEDIISAETDIVQVDPEVFKGKIEAYETTLVEMKRLVREHESQRIFDLERRLSSAELEITDESVLQKVTSSELFVSKESYDESTGAVQDRLEYLENTTSTFETTISGWEARVTTEIEDALGVFEDEFSDYIRWSDGKLYLGKSTSKIELVQQHDRISFMQGEFELAYFSDGQLFVNEITTEVLNLKEYSIKAVGNNLEGWYYG